MTSLRRLLSPGTASEGAHFDFGALVDNQNAFDFDFEPASQPSPPPPQDDAQDDATVLDTQDTLPDMPFEKLRPSQRQPQIPYQPRRISAPRDMAVPLTVDELTKFYSAKYNILRTGPAVHAAFHLPTPPTPPAAPAAPAPANEPAANLPPKPHIEAPSTATAKSLSSHEGLPHRPAETAPPIPRREQAPQHDPSLFVAKDTLKVASHYNVRPNFSREQRNDSPIIGLKNFNNWIKTVLINQYCVNPHERRAYPGGPRRRNNVLQTNLLGGPKLKVLDMGCGKGGDLNKWGKVGTGEYYGVDVAQKSVEQAMERYENSYNKREYKAKFKVLDCFSNPIDTVFSPAELQRKFDVVSMQFCMHYAFKSPANARIMLENVSAHLRYGGMFIGTIPDAELLLEQLDKVDPSIEPPSFGNSRYRVSFSSRHDRPTYGFAYNFWLQDAVDDVPEYIVQWDVFEELAKEYNLQLVFHATFGDLFFDHKDAPEYKELMQRMRVVNAEGESNMDEEMWEAANLYVGVVQAAHQKLTQDGRKTPPTPTDRAPRGQAWPKLQQTAGPASKGVADFASCAAVHEKQLCDAYLQEDMR